MSLWIEIRTQVLFKNVLKPSLIYLQQTELAKRSKNLKQ